MEERQGRILDANNTKVDIDIMVDEMDIQRSSKRALNSTLKKFPKLFGGLGASVKKPESSHLDASNKSLLTTSNKSKTNPYSRENTEEESRRARIRWSTAYLLLKNPSLLSTRKAFMFESGTTMIGTGINASG